MTRVDEVLQALKTIEPLPQVGMRILEISRKDDVVPRELVNVLQIDGAMTAKVLRLTNSAYYGFKRKIATLEEAGNLLGVSTLVNLVLTSCTGKYFRDVAGVSAERRAEMWRRSIANAVATSLLARIHGGVDKNRAYTAGLLMDLGELVVERWLAPEQERIDARRKAGEARVDIERDLLGIDHAEVGALLCERWNFPAVLADTVRWHHEPERSSVDTMLCCFAHLGDQIASHLADRLGQRGGRSALAGGAAAHRARRDEPRRLRGDPRARGREGQRVRRGLELARAAARGARAVVRVPRGSTSGPTCRAATSYAAGGGGVTDGDRTRDLESHNLAL
jgi:HD-like signal output (HDOD) protein